MGRTLLEGRTLWGEHFFEGEHFEENTFFLLMKLHFDEGRTRETTVITSKIFGFLEYVIFLEYSKKASQPTGA